MNEGWTCRDAACVCEGWACRGEDACVYEGWTCCGDAISILDACVYEGRSAVHTRHALDVILLYASMHVQLHHRGSMIPAWMHVSHAWMHGCMALFFSSMCIILVHDVAALSRVVHVPHRHRGALV